LLIDSEDKNLFLKNFLSSACMCIKKNRWGKF
jgi:hypothetical protein